MNIQSTFVDQFFRFFSICSLQTNNNWNWNISHVLVCINNSLSNTVTTNDTTKDIDQNCFYVWIFQDDMECFFNTFSICSSTNIQEVCRVTTRVLDNVHSCHCKTCSVYHTSNVSVQFNEVQTSLVSFYIQ